MTETTVVNYDPFAPDPKRPLYTEEEAAIAEARRLNSERKRDNFEYGHSRRTGGWQICVYSND